MTLRPALLRPSLLLFALLGIAACNRSPEPAPAPAAPTPAETAAPAASPAASPTPDAAATPAPAPGPIVPPEGPPPVAGTDYVEIAGGQPFEAAPGQVELIEVFGYTCPGCARFEPILKGWKARKPADVNFVPLAAPFGGFWMPYAKAFYAAEALGIEEQSHDAVFQAIHVDRSLPVQPEPTPEQLGQFYSRFGVDAQKFASTMNSFAVNAKMKRAQQYMMRAGVESTPTLIVAGKYRVIGGQTHEDMLRIADHLIAQERAATSGPAAPAAADGAAAPAPDQASTGQPGEPSASGNGG